MTRTRGVAGARGTADAARRTALSRKAIPFWVGGAGVIVLLAVFIGSGGLAKGVTVPALVSAGAEARTSLYAATVVNTEVTDAVESQFLEAEPGQTLVVLTLEMENLSGRAIGLERSADRVESRMISSSEPLLELSGLPTPTGPARSWRADGTTPAVILQPGVPAEVKIAWSVADDALDDAVSEKALHLNVYDAVEQSGQVIISASTITWRRAELSAQIPLPVSR